MTSCSILLPSDFRTHEFFEFHGRDAQQVAERIDGGVLRKGLAWRGQPACLTLALGEGRAEARLQLDAARPDDAGLLAAMARRMLGLTQEVPAFEAAHRAHPQLGPLIAARPGLRVALAATPFEALTWAVTGQQVSLGAAIALRRKLICAAGLRHAGGLYCYPDAQALATLGVEKLRAAGFSQTKARTLVTLAEQVVAGLLPLDDWLAPSPPVPEMSAQLLALHGIGPWTVSYTLLRGYGWLDGSLHGDAGVCRGLQRLLHQADRVPAEQARQWLAGFAPWRALAAAHLWALAAGQ